MKTNNRRIRNRRAGFTMIEVLVAAAIMVVIVMMLAMLFQQTSLSWRTGVKRADAYMQIRSALGAIQRDASAAVDARVIPASLRSRLGGGNQQFSGSLRFFTLTGAGFKENSDKPFRALSFVTYNANGDRTEKTLLGDGSAGPEHRSNVLDFVRKASSQNKPVTKITTFEPKYGQDPNGLPLFVNIRATVTSSGNALDIGAASAGPDKTWGTKDDIKTWVE